MTDKFKGWYPDYIENEKEREPILKLAKMMTGRAKKKLGLEKMTKYDPEYWGLALLCTDEQAEIAMKMGVRQPKTLDQMVKVTGKDRDYLEKQLEEMAEVALVEYNWENPQHEKQYVLPIFVPGSAEFSCMNAKMLEKHPELGLEDDNLISLCTQCHNLRHGRAPRRFKRKKKLVSKERWQLH